MVHLSFINVAAAWNFTGDVGRERLVHFVAQDGDGEGKILYMFTLRYEPMKRLVSLDLPQVAFRAVADLPDLFAFLAQDPTMHFEELLAHIADVYEDVTQYEYPYARA